MNIKTLAAIFSAVAMLGLIISPTTNNAAAVGDHFLTSTAPYVTMADPEGDSVKAILTDGDTVGDYSFAKIPDGVGAFNTGNTLNVFVNHELNNGTNHGGFAKASKLKLDKDGAVISGEFAIDGLQEYERFCSSSLMEGNGFTHPVYFAGEEVDGGIVVGVDGRDGTVTEMPWLGELSHENTIHISHFYETAGKTVVITTEDGAATESEVYMYVADSPEDLMDGNGQLYVFAAEDEATYNTYDDVYYSTGSVSGKFVPVEWDYATEDGADLDAAAVSAGAFKFIRPEDAAMDKREGHTNVMYMADTGNDKDENGVDIPTGSNGQSWERGRMYKFEFTDPSDPTKAEFQVIMDGNDPTAPGGNTDMSLGLTNPDNIDTSQNSLMIQEDRIGTTRQAPTGDITKNAKIIMVDLETIDEGSAEMEIVAYNNQIGAPTAKHGDWESSGILNVSDFYGEGSWLVTVQAHSLQEGGQLLLMKVDGS